jgi:hypothetical protein
VGCPDLPNPTNLPLTPFFCVVNSSAMQFTWDNSSCVRTSVGVYAATMDEQVCVT